MLDTRIVEAVELMQRFAERTGLHTTHARRRYLWTDAFAVCNLLSLVQHTAETSYLDLAVHLIHEVHYTLGQHRGDDPRQGWISGLSEQEGQVHPTRGGLRIGKPLPERRLDEPFDDRLEWERDGQYFHYLTKWMHALDQVARITADGRFNIWARELAATAFDAFTYVLPHSGRRRMYWKMSIDLSRPLVPSIGLHDPLDGFITFRQLQTNTQRLGPCCGPELHQEAGQLVSMIETADLATVDPLGLGGLLIDAARLAQRAGQQEGTSAALLDAMLTAAREGLAQYPRDALRQPAAQRLAFRELGLALGLHALDTVSDFLADGVTGRGMRERVESLRRYLPLRDDIESFWRDPEHQESRTWTEHLDINEVMLATCLAPEGFLILRTPHPTSD
jgi:hypothetical protein